MLELKFQRVAVSAFCIQRSISLSTGMAQCVLDAHMVHSLSLVQGDQEIFPTTFCVGTDVSHGLPRPIRRI
jgi:hypothetical protein